MRALYRSLLVATLCVAVSVFMFDGVSDAKKGGGSKVKLEVRAELEPFGSPAPEPDAEGKARHKKETRTKNDVMTIKKDEFKAAVEFPVPSPGLEIADEAAAEDAEVLLILSRGGVDFATCLMEFDEVEDDEAEFKVDVRIRKDTLRERKGTCGGSVPDAQAGDVATATLNGTPFLQGTFICHKCP